jgi:hypothetical protein
MGYLKKRNKGFISTLTLLFITATSLIPLISSPPLQPLIQSVLGTSTSVYVTGKVIDIRGGNIMGATVSISNSTYATTQYTTSAGFAFIVPGNSTYTLRASKSGFKPTSINVTVGTKPVSNIVMTLQASNPPPTSSINSNSGSSNTDSSSKTNTTTQNNSASQNQSNIQPRTISGAVNIVDSSGNITGPYTQGAKITIDNGQGGVKTVTTDSKGTFLFTSNAITPNLTYTITLKPISGYTIVSQNPISRSLQPGVSTTAYFRIKATNQSDSSDSSNKTSKRKTISGHVYLANAAGTPYTSYTEGAKIRITNTSTGKSGSTTTDQNGYYIFDSLASGSQTYTITLTLPTGYTAVSATSFTTTISDGKNNAIDFVIRKTNKSSNSSVTKTISGHIFVVDDSGKSTGTYAGATIHITNTQSKTSTDIKTDRDGYFLFTSQEKGTATYTVELKKTANFTIVSEPKLTKTLNDGDNTVVNFSVRKTAYGGGDASITQPLKIILTTTVVDENGNKLPLISINACSTTPSGDGTGIENCINGQTNNSGYVNLVVPANSKITISLEGTYNGSKYRGNDVVYTQNSNRSVTLKALRESKADFSVYGFIWLDKNNDNTANEASKNHDGGFDFDGLRLFLKKKDNSYGKEFKTVWVESGHGYFQFSGLKQGEYTLTLQDVPEGYKLITSPTLNISVPPSQYVNFIVQNTSSSTSTKNDRKYKISGHVYVDTNKNFYYDSKDTVVAGVEIKVLHGPSITTITKSRSNGNGEYTLSNLPPALYTLQLSSTLEGFQATSYYATVNLQNRNLVLNWELKETKSKPIKNSTMWIDGRVSIRKKEGKQLYKGAKISLTDANGGTRLATTDDAGYFKFNNLGPGRYIVEFVSPTNALLESEKKVFTFLSFREPNQSLYWTIASLASQDKKQSLQENNSPSIVPTQNKKIVAHVWIIDENGESKPYNEEYGRITLQAFNDNGQHRTAEKIGNGAYEMVPLVMNHYTVKIKLPNTLNLVSDSNISVTFTDSKEDSVDFYVKKK